MNSDELNEKLFDELLAHAAELSMENIAKEFPSNEELKKVVTFSPKYEKRMQSIIKKTKRIDQAEVIRKKFLRVGIPVAVSLVICFTVVSNVEALRVPVLNFFNSIGNQSTTIQIQNNVNNYENFADQIKGLYLPEFVPDTYKLKSIDKNDSTYLIEFNNGNGGFIQLQNLTNEYSAGIDNENSGIEKITVNGEPAQLFVKNNITTLIFEYDQNAFRIMSTIPKDDIILMAQSMSYQK